MTLPTAKRIAIWISEEVSVDKYASITDVAAVIFSTHVSCSLETALDYIEEQKPAIIDELGNLRADTVSDGLAPTYELSDEDGTVYIKATPTPEMALLGPLRRLSPEGFECLCTGLLREIGADSVRVGNKDDGGIDFLGYYLSPGPATCVVPKCSRLVIIGQAKRYRKDNLVKETEVRKFIGGAMKEVFELRKSRPDIGPLTPVLYAFWTTSDFHSSAKKYVNDMGIWGLNGIGIIQFIHRMNLSALLE